MPARPVPWAHTSLAFVLIRAGKHKSGRVAAEEALRLDPNYTQAHALLADAEQKLGEYRRCVQTARRGLAVDPTHEGLLSQLGWGLVRLGRTEEAGEVAERGLEQHPNSASLHNLAGWICHVRATADPVRFPVYRLPAYRRAEGHFAEAVRSNPVEPAYRENRETNATAARKHALLLVLIAAGCVALAQFGLTFAVRKIDAKYDPMIMAAMAQCGWLFVITLHVRHSRIAILSAPLAWWNVPTIPLEPAERRRGRFDWAILLVIALAMVLATIGIGIYVPWMTPPFTPASRR